jgi:hypothetical protein
MKGTDFFSSGILIFAVILILVLKAFQLHLSYELMGIILGLALSAALIYFFKDRKKDK